MIRSSIQSFFGADHDRLRRLFTEFDRRKRTDPAAAAGFLRDFACGLRRHIRWEEEILFPIFEAKSAIRNGGPTHVMRLEHVEIRGFLAEIEEAVAHGREPGEAQVRLSELLAAHDGKEEGVLYPSIDMLVSAVELSEIFRRIDAIEDERDERRYAV